MFFIMHIILFLQILMPFFMQLCLYFFHPFFTLYTRCISWYSKSCFRHTFYRMSETAFVNFIPGLF